MPGERKYPPGGVLFKNTKGKGPDYSGRVEVDEKLVAYLADKLQRGEEATLELAGFVKQGKNGSFISLKPDVPWKERQGQQAGPPRTPFRQKAFDLAPRRNPDVFGDDPPF